MLSHARSFSSHIGMKNLRLRFGRSRRPYIWAPAAITAAIYSKRGRKIRRWICGRGPEDGGRARQPSMVAVRLRSAVKPDSYSSGQLAAAGALAAIGLNLSVFNADQAFSRSYPLACNSRNSSILRNRLIIRSIQSRCARIFSVHVREQLPSGREGVGLQRRPSKIRASARLLEQSAAWISPRARGQDCLDRSDSRSIVSMRMRHMARSASGRLQFPLLIQSPILLAWATSRGAADPA